MMKINIKQLNEGLGRWAVIAFKQRWVKPEDWEDEEELASSIQSYVMGNDLIKTQQNNIKK